MKLGRYEELFEVSGQFSQPILNVQKRDLDNFSYHAKAEFKLFYLFKREKPVYPCRLNSFKQ